MNISKNKALNIARILIVVFFVIAIVIDFVLVFTEEFPTFSAVIKKHRNELIPFSFLFGGLISKIYLNRLTKEKKRETFGLIVFILILTGLAILGQILPSSPEISVEQQIILLLAGAFYTIAFWPQFERHL